MNQVADKIVFFDIDGVMLPGRAFAMPENAGLLDAKVPTMTRMEQARFHPEALNCLNKLCVQHNAKLVLMSSWGNAWWDRGDELQDKFVTQGIAREHFHADWCPFGPDYEFGKHPKTLQWLKAHQVTRFAIIDDEPHLYRDDGLADVHSNIVKTDPKIGLDRATLHVAQRVLAMEIVAT